MRESPRVLMVGVDAAELSFIRGALPSLPTFRRLFDEGVFHPLTSSAEYVSASVWPTMYTGTMPGEHGICQHIQWDPAAMRMRRITIRLALLRALLVRPAPAPVSA